MLLVRRIGAVVLAVAAALIWFVMAPDEPSSASGDVSQALAEYELNEARTEGAPQQQVVNGWVARDLLAIIAEQQDRAVSDERLPALAVLIVFGLALHLATTSRPGRPGDPFPVTGPPSPDPSVRY